MRNFVLTSIVLTSLATGLAAQTSTAKSLTAFGMVGQHGHEPVVGAAFPANTSIQTGYPMLVSMNERLPNRSGYLRARARATYRSVNGLPALRINEVATIQTNLGAPLRLESTSDTTAPFAP